MLYREPKLLKAVARSSHRRPSPPVSVLYREPKLLKAERCGRKGRDFRVSVLYREPKLLKAIRGR